MTQTTRSEARKAQREAQKAVQVQSRAEFTAMRKAFAKAGVRGDSWKNLYTGIGVTGVDKLMSSEFAQRPTIGYNQQFALYRENWIAKRQVDDLVDDAIRSGFTFSCTDDPDLAQYVYEAWQTMCAIERSGAGLVWALVCGGSVGLLLTDDEALTTDIYSALKEPLDPSTMNEIKQIVVVDSRYAIPNLGNYTTDPNSANFGKPTFYQVTPYGYSATTPSYTVHWSRLIRFDGVPTDNLTRVGNLTWGDSIYQGSYDALMRYGMIYQGASLAAAEFGLKVLKMNGLSRLMATEQYSEILARVNGVKMGLSAARMAVVDNGEPGQAGEELVLQSQPVAGLSDLMDRSKQEVAGATHQNLARLFGQSEGALASAESNDETWQEWVHAWQKRCIIPSLKRLTELWLQSKSGAKYAKPGLKWEIIPNPIDPPDLGKELEQRERQAKVDNLYYAMGALEPGEIRTSRFGGTHYSHDTTLDPSITTAIESNDKAALAASKAEDDSEEDAAKEPEA